MTKIITRRAALGGLASLSAAGAASAAGVKIPDGSLEPSAVQGVSDGNTLPLDRIDLLAPQLAAALAEHREGKWFAIVCPSDEVAPAFMLRPLAALPMALCGLPSAPFDYVRGMRDDGFVFVCRGDRSNPDGYAIRKATKTGRDDTADFLLALIRLVSA